MSLLSSSPSLSPAPLAEQTDELLAKVNHTRSQGAVAVYDEQFMEMEKQLMEIKNILDGFNQTAADMSDMVVSFERLRYAKDFSINRLWVQYVFLSFHCTIYSSTCSR